MITKEKQNNVFDTLKKTFKYDNKMQTPKITKVVVSTGVGKIKDKKQIEFIQDRLTKITGQKPAPRGAKKSIASFKIRQGDIIGFQVTLRGPRMYDFLDRFLVVSLPRTRDFRGLKSSTIDEMGNITIGIREHTIFPETSDEELKDIFGLSVTIVTTAKTKEETKELIEHLGFPIRKEEKK